MRSPLLLAIGLALFHAHALAISTTTSSTRHTTSTAVVEPFPKASSSSTSSSKQSTSSSSSALLLFPQALSTAASLASSSASSSSSSTGCQPTQTVLVNPGASHAYSPNQIFACVGGLIVFAFQTGNHSVAKADFLTPCAPSATNEFFSGSFGADKFPNVDSNGYAEGVLPTWNLTVNDTSPTFFYCTALDSCLVNLMVGVINPNSTHNITAQQAAAKTFGYMQVPGQQIPAQGFREGFSASSAPAHHGLSGGAIAGIVIGALAALGLVIFLVFLLGRYRGMLSEEGRESRTRAWTRTLSGGPSKWSGTRSDLASIPPHEQRSFSPPVQEAHGYNPAYAPHSGHWSWNSNAGYTHTQQQTQELGAHTDSRPFSPSELDATPNQRD